MFRLIPIILFCFITQSALADETDCIDTGSTRCQALAAQKASQTWDDLLNHNYQILIKALKHYKLEKEKDTLVKTQREWIKFRDLNCELSNQIIGGINSISWTRCMEDMTSQRANEIGQLLNMYDLRFLEE